MARAARLRGHLIPFHGDHGADNIQAEDQTSNDNLDRNELG
jgi:hypothetical protein